MKRCPVRHRRHAFCSLTHSSTAKVAFTPATGHAGECQLQPGLDTTVSAHSSARCSIDPESCGWPCTGIVECNRFCRVPVQTPDCRSRVAAGQSKADRLRWTIGIDAVDQCWLTDHQFPVLTASFACSGFFLRHPPPCGLVPGGRTSGGDAAPAEEESCWPSQLARRKKPANSGAFSRCRTRHAA